MAGLIVLTILFAPLFSACNEVVYPGKQFQQGESYEKINNAIATAIEEGKVQELMPPTIVMVVAVMVPITTIIGFFIFLVIFTRLWHRRNMAMIEKGVYKPSKWRWDLIVLFFGLLLSFVGVGVSITATSYFGPQPWTVMSGVLPLFLGIAFLLFYKFSDLKNK